MLAVAFGLLNDHSAAEDVVHDVFVAFAQSAERLSPAGSLRSDPTTCTANLARDRCRAISGRPDAWIGGRARAMCPVAARRRCSAMRSCGS